LPAPRAARAVRALPAGASLTDTITVSSYDGTATQQIVVTIHGTNDVPVISGNSAGAVQEDGQLGTSGQLLISDVDTGESSFQAVASGTNGDNGHGTFTVAADGSWSYALTNDDPAVQALPAGASLPDTLTGSPYTGTDTPQT